MLAKFLCAGDELPGDTHVILLHFVAQPEAYLVFDCEQSANMRHSGSMRTISVDLERRPRELKIFPDVNPVHVGALRAL